jgi:hypothetical protein
VAGEQPAYGTVLSGESLVGTWRTVRGTEALRQNLKVELTKTGRRSTDALDSMETSRALRTPEPRLVICDIDAKLMVTMDD